MERNISEEFMQDQQDNVFLVLESMNENDSENHRVRVAYKILKQLLLWPPRNRWDEATKIRYIYLCDGQWR